MIGKYSDSWFYRWHHDDWARALGELGATILFAGNFPEKSQTMPLAIFIGYESNIDIALTLSVILLLLSSCLLFSLKLLLENKTS